MTLAQATTQGSGSFEEDQNPTLPELISPKVKNENLNYFSPRRATVVY